MYKPKKRMTNDKIITRVTNFLSKALTKTMKDLVIFKNDDGTYEFFNKYLITEDPDGAFTVEIKGSYTQTTFSSLKNAVTWCIFINRNKYDKASRIEQLDAKMSSLDMAMDVHRNLIKTSKTLDSKLIYLAKLSEEQARKQTMVYELTTYINESKYLQAQRFGNKSQNKQPMINNR